MRRTALLLAFACIVLTAAPACIVPPHRRVVVGYHAPATVAVGRTGIYWCNELEGDYFYYRGYWYWCDGPYWYRSSRWGAGWRYIENPPRAFLSIPRDHYVADIVYRHPGHRDYRVYRKRHYSDWERPNQNRGFRKVARGPRPVREGAGPGLRGKVRESGGGGGGLREKTQPGRERPPAPPPKRGGIGDRVRERPPAPPPKGGGIGDRTRKKTPAPPPKKGTLKEKKEKKPPAPKKKGLIKEKRR